MVAPTRKNRSVIESIVASTKTRGIDLLVYTPITVRYEVVANVRKELATTEENNKARVGFFLKIFKGRMCDLEDENFARMHFLYDGLRCSTEFITGLISDEETVVFRELLELPPHVDVANRTNEDHLSPPQHMETITRVVRRMREKGVGGEETATFSQALSVKDGITAACLRSQDSLSIPAYNAYIKAGEMEFILPTTPKNGTQLKQSGHGMAATHVKSKECADDYTVMLVVLRLLMRELFGEVEGGGLCASIGPFDSKGKAFNAGRQYELFKFVGVHFLGIPRFSTHTFRTIHVTMVCTQCVDRNISIHSPEVQVVFNKGRHGVDQCTKDYNVIRMSRGRKGGVTGMSTAISGHAGASWRV